MKTATCGGCDVRWVQVGNRTGHCAECHHTFSGITTFDAHQAVVDGKNHCIPPYFLLNKKTGSMRFKLATDGVGCQVWRSAKDQPKGVWTR